MALHTRVEPGVEGYNGVNIYLKGEYIGDAIWKQTKNGKIKVMLEAKEITIVPKACDRRDDDKYDFDDEDCIE